MAVLSSPREQPQIDTPVLLALPNSSKMRPTAIRTELAGPKKSRPSRPDRSSRVTAMPLACSPHLQWLMPALAAVLNLSGSDILIPSALPIWGVITSIRTVVATLRYSSVPDKTSKCLVKPWATSVSYTRIMRWHQHSACWLITPSSLSFLYPSVLFFFFPSAECT